MKKKLLYLLPTLLLGSGLFAQNPTPIGLEFLVNTTQTGTQEKPAIDVNPNGDFVIAWESPDAVNDGIYAQRFDNTYNPVGGEFRVNSSQSSQEHMPEVSMFDDGSFVVTWLVGSQVKFRTFDSSGSPITGDVNGPGSLGPQVYGMPWGISTDGDSLIVIAYRDNGIPNAIRAQRYYKNGTTMGGVINVSEGGGLNYGTADVAMHSDRSFVVTLSTHDNSSPYIHSVYTKRYNSSGVPITPQTICITDQYRSNTTLKVDMNNSGEYTLSSIGRASAGSRSIVGRIYDATGTALSGQITAYGPVGSPGIQDTDGDINEGGNIVLTWDWASSGSSQPYNVKSRLYTSSGSAMGSEFVVTTTTADDQEWPEGIFMPDGTLFYVWCGNGFVGDVEGIYARRFNAPAFPCTSAGSPTLSSNVTICQGNSTTLSVTGGVLNDAANWQWYSGSCGGTPEGSGTTIAVSPSVTTTYYARGEGGCLAGPCASVTVTVNPMPNVTASGTSTICEGESTLLSASGANTYLWDNGVGSGSIVSVSPTTTTIYTVTGADGNGCESTAQVAVTVNPSPNVTASNDVQLCDGDATTLTVSGANTYSWNNGAGSGSSVTVSPGITTTYTVTGTDGNGCENTDQVMVTVNPLPTVTASNDVQLCDGDATTLTVSGANTYSWNNGAGSGSSVTVSPGTTTTYTVTGTDGNGCENTDQVMVTVTPLPTVTASNDVQLCDGDATTLTVSGANTYSWDNGAGNGSSVTVSPATTTTYTVTGTDGNGCENNDQVMVTVNPLPTVTASNDVQLCDGDATTLTVSGANTYSWDNGAGNGSSVTVSPGTTTTYTVTGTDGNGCENTDQVMVTVNPLPTVTASNDVQLCDGDATTLTVSGANTYSWDNGAGNGSSVTVSPGTTTTYTVTGTDGNGCENTDQVMVTVNPLPTVTASNDVQLCDGDATTLMASGADTYSWDNGAGSGSSVTVSPGTTTTYTVTGTDGNGCENTDQVMVTVTPLPTVTASNDVQLCDGDATMLTASGADTYSWDNGAGSGSSVTVSPGTTTTYTVTGTDGNGCENTDQVTITVNPLPDTSVALSNYVLTALNGAGVTYQWVDCDNGYSWMVGATGQSYTPMADGNYAVIVTESMTGCVDTSSCYTIIGTGVTQLANNIEVSAYPNPVNELLTIDMGAVYNQVDVQVTNLAGQLIDRAQYPMNRIVRLTTTKWPAGSYQVHIITEEGVAVLKVLKAD